MNRPLASRLRVWTAALAAAFGGGVWWASGRRRRTWRTDGLTGVATREGAVAHLRAELMRSTRSGRVVGVAFCDIDAFKQVNDRHGHLAGDLVLVAAAQCLRDAVRPSDVVARVGGDEFVVVCGGLRSSDDMGVITERLHAALHDGLAAGNAPQPLSDSGVTVSIGTAVGRGGDVSPGALLHAADRSMYHQKGRRH